jgi:hypothetical protein
MPHKILDIVKKEGKMPYVDTTVDFDKSFAEIQQLLRKFGCGDVFTRSQASTVPKIKVPCTIHSIGFVHKGSKFLIEFPVTVVVQGREGSEKRVVNMNISGRIVLNKVKALLVDVEIGHLTFEQSMLPYQLITDNTGRTLTIADMVDENRNKLKDVGAIECLMLSGGTPP